MADARATTIAVVIALTLATIAVCIPFAGALAQNATVASWGLNGFATMTVLPLQIVLLITLWAYLGAAAIPQNRLALIQAIVMTVWGIAMIVIGVMLLVTGIASFASKVALLLAFPFGTIAYFARYSCTEGDLTGLAALTKSALGGGCMTGTQLSAIAILGLSGLALGSLLIASIKFAKVTGLLVTVALISGFAVAIVGAFWALSEFHFLLFPLDGILTALLGLSVAIYGLVSFVKSLFALALAIAGQVG